MTVRHRHDQRRISAADHGGRHGILIRTAVALVRCTAHRGGGDRPAGRRRRHVVHQTISEVPLAAGTVSVDPAGPTVDGTRLAWTEAHLIMATSCSGFDAVTVGRSASPMKAANTSGSASRAIPAAIRTAC